MSALPTVPVVAPKATPVTVFVSPVSMSVSFARTPEAATVSVASSLTLPVSATATGASLAPWIVIVNVAVEVRPPLSFTV